MKICNKDRRYIKKYIKEDIIDNIVLLRMMAEYQFIIDSLYKVIKYNQFKIVNFDKEIVLTKCKNELVTTLVEWTDN